jgi:hypothetical protein
VCTKEFLHTNIFRAMSFVDKVSKIEEWSMCVESSGDLFGGQTDEIGVI